MQDADRHSFRLGIRRGTPYAIAGTLLAASFGAAAHTAGMPAGWAIAMSAIVYAGSAQFAALSILAAGGTIPAALVAAAMMNSRFLAMGISMAPSLPGGRLRRFVQGQPIVDSSWALSMRPDGSFDRYLMFGVTAPQYVTWQLGTVLGVYASDLIGDTNRFGLDAVFPAFFLALLLVDRPPRGYRRVALAGAGIALLLTPFTPAGVPILAAALAAFWGLRLR